MDRKRTVSAATVFGELYVLVILSLLCCGHVQDSMVNVIRDTTLGQVKGLVREPVPGETPSVEYFYGIPFAQPPIGPLRFENPEPMPSWEPAIRDALGLHPACPQIDDDILYIQEHRVDFNHTSEDCLYLNVFMPRMNDSSAMQSNNSIENGTMASEPLAVLVFIHGGSNVVGTANMFDGDILAATGEIVVVSVNFRLAVLGFLGTGDEDFPGNYGLADMIAALRWVQDNIAFFNGDPNKVTVLGHSQSAMDVGVLLVSPLAKGLFRTVISQSGPPTSIATARWSDHDSKKEILELGKHLNCERSTLSEVKECLKTITNVTLLLQSHPMYDFNQFPVVVGDSIVPKSPEELLMSGEINAENFLIGTTRNEAGRWAIELQGYNNTARGLMGYHILPKEVDIKDLVYYEYNDMTYAKNDSTDFRVASSVFGDSMFDAPTVTTLELLSRRNVTLHQYRWEWRSSEYPYPNYTGVPHGADLFYLFGSPLSGHALYNYTEEDKNMSRVMMNQWSHYVKYQTFDVNSSDWPTPPSDENLKYNTMSKMYTRFYNGDEGKPAMDVGYDLKPRQAFFWNNVVPKLKSDISKAVSDAQQKPPVNPGTPDMPGPEEKPMERDLFIILFIIFLVLSCLLLLLLMFVCGFFCTRRKGENFSLPK